MGSLVFSVFVFCLFVFISKSFFSQKYVKTFNQIPVWRSKGIRLFVVFEILTICIPNKSTVIHWVLQYHHSFGQGWAESLPLFKPSSFPPVVSISRVRRNFPVLRGPHSMADADMQGDSGICSFSPAPLGVDHPHQHSTRPPVILLHFTGRGLPPAVGRWERGNWTRVCFEHLIFHSFTENSKNGILILNPRKRYRDTVCCKWSRVIQSEGRAGSAE